MAYRVAICDDSPVDSDYIQDLLTAWAGARDVSVQAERFSSAEQFLFRYAADKAFDILLLDIEMGAMDGVTLAKRVRQDNEAVQIVFITGYSDYIAEGYEVAALHFLVKPVKREKVFSVLDRAVERLHKNERALTLESGEETVRVPLCQIRFLDVQRNYVTIHAREDHTVRKTLSQLEAQLDERFYRVGRSAIVNLGCVSRVTKTGVYLKDGAVIPLPRGAYEGINRAIIQMG